MTTIARIDADLYHVPLPVTLSDSTHGEMTFFELVTARVRDGDGAEGVGYTFTVGANGRAAQQIIVHDMAPTAAAAERRAWPSPPWT